ncbi:MAG: M48 family metalloprotease [Mariprofundaceae bacterium]
MPAYAGLFSVSERDEVAIGRQAAIQVEQKASLLRDQFIQQYVSDLGMQLAHVSRRPQMAWRFRVIKDDHINAFALPGGFIYIHSKILELATSEAELASVIAHEIGHIEGFHHKSQIERAMRYQLGLGLLGAVFGRGAGADYALIAGRLLAQGQLTKYSREAEADADRRGVHLLYRARYNPYAMSKFLSNLVKLDRKQSSGFFADHPNARDRVASTHALARSLPEKSWRRNSSSFLSMQSHMRGRRYNGNTMDAGHQEGARIRPPAASQPPYSGHQREGARITP